MKRLYKSDTNKKVSGVCAGIADYFNLDPTLIRILWVVLTLCSVGLGLFAYVLCALIMPNQSSVM